MKRSLIFAILVLFCTFLSAQLATGVLVPKTGRAQFDETIAHLRAPATYGGEVKSVRRRASAHDATTTPTAPAKFEVKLGLLEINEKNGDQYVVPVSVSSIDGTPVKSVRMTVNGSSRAAQDFSGEFILDKGYSGKLPLTSTEYGSVRVGVVVNETEPFEDGYDVAQCRVPDLFAIANPPHDTRNVIFTTQLKGRTENLMLGGAMVLWTSIPSAFDKFDPNLPQDQWPGTIQIVNTRLALSGGFLRGDYYFWPGMSGAYMTIVPSTCGRWAKSKAAAFYTDARPQPRTTNIRISYDRPQPGELLKATATLENARYDGYIYGSAVGFNPAINWYHEHFDLPFRVVASDDPQTGHFEFYTFLGFSYSLNFQYYGLNQYGYLELVADESTPRNIPGVMPCYFCP